MNRMKKMELKEKLPKYILVLVIILFAVAAIIFNGWGSEIRRVETQVETEEVEMVQIKEFDGPHQCANYHFVTYTIRFFEKSNCKIPYRGCTGNFEITDEDYKRMKENNITELTDEEIMTLYDNTEEKERKAEEADLEKEKELAKANLYNEKKVKVMNPHIDVYYN